MDVVFDLDGVLFDTHKMVKEAYKKAGVDMPDEAWGLPWRSWLPDIVGARNAESIHVKKNHEYLKLMREGNPPMLAPLSILRSLHESRVATVGVLTGASWDAATALMTSAQCGAIKIYGAGMTSVGKVDALLGLASRGIYIDDQPFDVPGWRVVRYTPGQTRGEVLDNLWMP